MSYVLLVTPVANKDIDEIMAFYDSDNDEVRVLAVIHTSRDPRYISKRTGSDQRP